MSFELNSSGADFLQEAEQHSTDLHHLFLPVFRFYSINQVEFGGELEMILELRGRSDSDVKELGEIRITRPAASFGDVGWNRKGGSTNLADQLSIPPRWNLLAAAMAGDGGQMSFLPDRQVLVVLHGGRVSGGKEQIVIISPPAESV